MTWLPLIRFCSICVWSGLELKKLKPHTEAVGGKVIYFPRLLLIYLASQVDKSGGRITVALLKPLDRDYLPDDLTELKFPVRIYDWKLNSIISQYLGFQGEFTTNKHGMMIPFRAVGAFLLLQFAELCGQREELDKRPIDLVHIYIYVKYPA